MKYSIDVNGHHVCNYTCDFRYAEDGELVVEDSKGAGTAAKRDFKLVVKLMKACHGIEVRVTGVRLKRKGGKAARK